MKINFITFMVRDLEKSLIFYKNLAGLQVIRKLDIEPGEIVFLANSEGETMLELVSFKFGEKIATTGMVVSFSVEKDLETLREKALELGYRPSEIIDRNPKPKYFVVEDPDGTVIEFGN